MDCAIPEINQRQFFSIVQHHSGVSSFQFWYHCELPFIVKLWTFLNVTFDFYFSTLYRSTFHLNLFFILNKHHYFRIILGTVFMGECPGSNRYHYLLANFYQPSTSTKIVVGIKITLSQPLQQTFTNLVKMNHDINSRTVPFLRRIVFRSFSCTPKCLTFYN